MATVQNRKQFMIYDKKTNTIREKEWPHPDTIETIQHLKGSYYYDKRLEEYELHLSSLKSYPCHPSCKELWEGNREVIEGKDYELIPLEVIAGNFNKIFACPITPIQEESEDEVWQDVIKVVETNQFLSTKYKEVTDTLKQSFTIKRKQS